MSQSIATTVTEIEKKFDVIGDITNQVALVNNIHESDVGESIETMKQLIAKLQEYDLEAMSVDHRQYYLSHMSFHREIVADIITEARSLLIEERRHHLKTLVSYHREFRRWFSSIERRYS